MLADGVKKRWSELANISVILFEVCGTIVSENSVPPTDQRSFASNRGLKNPLVSDDCKRPILRPDHRPNGEPR